MSTDTSTGVLPETTDRITAPAVSSADSFVERLGAEVSMARERVRSLQTDAAEAFAVQAERFIRFVAVAERIHLILLPRLDTFTNVDVFKDITQSVSQEGQGLDVRKCHSIATTLSLPFSTNCPAKVQLSFRIGHDGPVEHAIIDYRLEILPIFFTFDSHDQFMVPINDPDDDAIAGWIEDKLVGFTKSFFELSFHKQYQEQHMATDPVMNIRFPKAYAAGEQEYRGRTYFFYTNESLLAFEKEPSAYVATV